MPDADDLTQLLVTPGQVADPIGVRQDGRVRQIGFDSVELRLECGYPVVEHGNGPETIGMVGRAPDRSRPVLVSRRRAGAALALPLRAP